MIRGFRDRNYYRNYDDEEEREICDYGPVDDENVIHSCHSYKFNIVKEYEDIYIEVRSCLDGELYMTIDAKKIIPRLSLPLEDEEWEKFKKKGIRRTN